MSRQSICVDTFVFEWMKDIQSIMDGLVQSDPEAAHALQAIDWLQIREHVLAESLRQLAQEQGWLFFNEHSDIQTHEQGDRIVGLLRRGPFSDIEIGISISNQGTCQCFGHRRVDDSNMTQANVRPRLQTRLEELYRVQMAQTVIKILLNTDADQIQTSPDGTIIMRFPIKEGV